jgi:pimeloyl-ACP methyl ester carboxylesterase
MLAMPDSWAARSRSELYLADRRCPVLSFYTVMRAEVADWERSLDPQVETRIVDTGHWIHQEKPNEVNRWIRQWIETLA